MRRSIGLLVLETLVLLGAACGGGNEADESAAGQATVAAQTAVVSAQGFTETVGALGVVTGRPGHVATLGAPVPARIASVNVAVGQHVSAGTPLVTFDQTSFTGASQAADAALATAQRNYDRTSRLAAEGIAPRKDVEQAASELAQARANAANAHREQQLSVLRSPLAGVVTRVNAVLGATADPAQPLVEVVDPSALDIVFSVSPSAAASVHSGDVVTLRAGQNASGEALGVAKVVDVGGAVDLESRSVAVRAQARTTRRPLRTGETVFGEIAVRTQPSAIVVPAEALVPEGEGFKVFVVDAKDVAHARPVTVGGRTDKLAEITSGLRAGERIVTYGAYGVDDSAKVVSPGTAHGTTAGTAPRE